MKLVYLLNRFLLNEILTMFVICAMTAWVIIDGSLYGLQWTHLVASAATILWTAVSIVNGFARDIAITTISAVAHTDKAATHSK